MNCATETEGPESDNHAGSLSERNRLAAGKLVELTARPDTVVVLQGEKLATKRFIRGADGQPVKVEQKPSLRFTVETRTVESVDDLAEMLRDVERDPNVLAIRGALTEAGAAELETTGSVRRKSKPSHSREGGVCLPSWRDVPRTPVTIDVDSFSLPAGLDPVTDPEAVARAIRDALPAPFRGAACVLQWSSSAGMPWTRVIGPDGSTTWIAKAHVWFILERPVGSAELRRYFAPYAAPRGIVDCALYSPVQPHYVAAPVFDDELPDPFGGRSRVFTLDGEPCVELPDLPPPPDPPPRDAPDAEAVAAIPRAERITRAERWLADWAPAIQGEGGRTHTFATAAHLARGFALSDDDAFVLLREWNERCDPPWSEDELHERLRAGRDEGEEPIGGRLADTRAWLRGLSTSGRASPGGKGDAPSAIIALEEIASTTELYRSGGVAYARFEVPATATIGQHPETHEIKARGGFGRWLRSQYYAQTSRSLPVETVSRVVAHAEAMAVTPADVHLRVASDGGCGLWMDLGDDEWRAVHVTREGWVVEKRGSPLFRRTAATRPIPVPVRGGAINELFEFLPPLAGDGPKALIKAWLIGSISGLPAYPIAMLTGPPGSGKSTSAEMLRTLVDPGFPKLRQRPRSVRDLAIAAKRGHVIALDNLSDLPSSLADGLCCIGTGTGHATRRLHTDDEESVTEGARPIILSSIATPSARSDLIDRAAVAIELAPLDGSTRRELGPLWEAFEEALPRLTGALLDRMVGALRELPTARRDPGVRGSRMVDFVALAVAAELASGETPCVLDALANVRRDGTASALDGALIGGALRQFVERARETAGSVEGQELWAGTVSALGKALEDLVYDRRTGAVPRDWPRSAQGVSAALARLTHPMRDELRVVVKRDRVATRRIIRLVNCR